MERRGFTLIELLVVIGIIGLLMTVTFAGWGSFRNKKTLEGMSQEIASQLKKTRSRAINGEKPSEDCGTLDGYQVQVNESLQIIACCDNPDPESDRSCNETGDPELMSDNFSIDPSSFGFVYDNFPVVFRVLSGAVDDRATISLSYGGIGGDVTISKSGEIFYEETGEVTPIPTLIPCVPQLPIMRMCTTQYVCEFGPGGGGEWTETGVDCPEEGEGCCEITP